MQTLPAISPPLTRAAAYVKGNAIADGLTILVELPGRMLIKIDDRTRWLTQDQFWWMIRCRLDGVSAKAKLVEFRANVATATAVGPTWRKGFDDASAAS